MTAEDAINEMIGEISLIIKTPKYGLQSVQEIPNEVLDSYKRIVDLGYNKYYYSDNEVEFFVKNFVDNTKVCK